MHGVAWVWAGEGNRLRGGWAVASAPYISASVGWEFSEVLHRDELSQTAASSSTTVKRYSAIPAVQPELICMELAKLLAVLVHLPLFTH